MHKSGYEFFGGEAFGATKNGSKGGVAVFVRARVQAPATHQCMIEGCGYTAISLRVKGINLLVASLYLKCDTPLHCPPNSTIVSSVAAVAADHVGQWIIAGGCNVSPTELADCSFARQIGGHVMSVGEPTTHSGGELDYVLVGACKALSGLAGPTSAPRQPSN